jgi:hypothetical protein
MTVVGQGSALRITVEAQPGDPLAEALALLDSLPAWEPARQEGEAQVYLALARSAWREADRLRELRRRREQR